MSECNAIIEANNEINRLKRENKKLNALCVQYGFDMGRLEEENEQLKQQNEQAIDLILDGIVEMHDGKRDYAEKLLNKAIELIN